MARRKFLRRTWNRYGKLGRKRKKKQKWRRPTGRDNKMREKRRSYPRVVSVGYRENKKQRGRIEERKPILIHNVEELEKVGKNEIVVVSSVGKKKKIEIAKKLKSKKLPVQNLNVNKFLKKIEKSEKKK